MKNKIFGLLAISMLLLGARVSYSGSATWNLDPVDAKWNNAFNWTPQTVPNRSSDTATFDVSNVPFVRLTQFADIAQLVFNPGASAFTINPSGSAPLTFRGAGIVNNSGVTQTFNLLAQGQSNAITFFNFAKAGRNVVINTQNSHTGSNSNLAFWQNSSAEDATINVAGALTPNGTTESRIFFFHTATAGTARFVMSGGEIGNGDGGTTEFDCDGCSAETATFVMNGSQVADGFGGQVVFSNTSNAADSTLIANGGTNGGGGGKVLLYFGSDGGNARVEVFDNGKLDISGHTAPGVTVGSIEGNGVVVLAANTLTVGRNNRDTLFSGSINDGPFARGGSLSKIGTGRLVLTEASGYTGSTAVNSGQLLVNNRRGSATGRGPVLVNVGKLGGSGIILGTVAVGSGSGPGAVLSPGGSKVLVGTLTIQHELSLQADGSYEFGINRDTATADQVVANGVTIDPGAQFASSSAGSGILPVGTVFTAISNTAATPIAGSFANLADGSTITIGSNAFQANYAGGDGNDLTLTVVP